MRILTISDVPVGQLQVTEIPERFRNVDLILSCGDLPFDYMEYVVSRLNKPMYYVFGNHAQRNVLLSSGKRKNKPEGSVNIHRQVINYDGLLIGGLEGSLRYNTGPHQYTQRQMAWMVRKMGLRLWWNRLRYGRSIDILITHAPPQGIHDQPDRPHQGFSAFLYFMERYRPSYLIHGHTHLYQRNRNRTTRYEDTLVVNTYGYHILEVDLNVLRARAER